MKPDVNPMIVNKRRISMELYSSTKEEIDKIVGITTCSECKRIASQGCDILLPQANIDNFNRQQLMMSVVHSVRNEDYRLAKEILAEEESATYNLGTREPTKHEQSILAKKRADAESMPDRRAYTNRRHFGVIERRQRDENMLIERRSLAWVHRRGTDRRKQHRIAAMPKPFVEPVAMRKDDLLVIGVMQRTSNDDFVNPKWNFNFQNLKEGAKFYIHSSDVKPDEDVEDTASHGERRQSNVGRKDDLDVYQDWTDTVAIYTGQTKIAGLAYAALGLTGESGEFADKLKKIIRTSSIGFYDRDTEFTLSEQQSDDLKLELGDALWYVARCARELGVTLGEIVKLNVDKLESRKQRDVINGVGDHR